MIRGATRWSRWAGRGRSTRRGSPASSGCARWWCRPLRGPPPRSGSWPPRSPTRRPVPGRCGSAEPDYATVESILRELEAEGRARLAEAGVGGGEGAGAGAGGARSDSGPAVVTERQADMRLRGQMHQISVPLPGEPLSPESLPVVLDAFAAEYQRRYTHLYEGAEIEVLNWRVGVHRGAGRGPLRPARGGRGSGRRRRGRRRRGCRRSRLRREGDPQGPPPGVGPGTRRLRGRSGPRPVRDGPGHGRRGAGDHRGARGDHHRPRRLHAHRGRGAQPRALPRRDRGPRASSSAPTPRSRRRSPGSRPIRWGSRSCGAG